MLRSISQRSLLWIALLLQLTVVLRLYVSPLALFALHYKMYLAECREQGHTHRVPASCALPDLIQEKIEAVEALNMLASLHHAFVCNASKF